MYVLLMSLLHLYLLPQPSPCCDDQVPCFASELEKEVAELEAEARG